ncbi:RNA polymerase sigma factor [Georgenia subflava]|uniref:Sigma-70 family RNA polymerase sigma factor n=1 Tax=Georgenia subflava TaxID=1622177 RepID=A0A6N7EMJ2_9MICO|nr:sigma-70 family RNA polymerase sigma factor [Georgenia subflava]MPV38087.1 sigma-70 family RNA polymerase sigma factor [Georgenia subflava]
MSATPRASGPDTEVLLRRLASQVLGALVRRYGHFDLAEDAVQEAMLAAATQWPAHGRPENPRAWLVTVASRRLTDLLRADQARRRREDDMAVRLLPEEYLAPAADSARTGEQDDSLVLLFLCCHPALTLPSQIALTLRAVGGLTTTEIARAFLVPETTMGQRISRAKQRLQESGARFRLPPSEDAAGRLGAVLHVLYLIFNEGYTSTAASTTHRAELAGEAVRLARILHEALPEDAEVTGLLALMLLTEARTPARTGPDGDLVSLADQDRALWDADAVAEGTALLTEALSRGRPGAYQLQAAIAAVHDEARTAEDTDWAQILALYDLLERLGDNPVVHLNRAVATAMVHGPRVGLALIGELESDPRMARSHRLEAVRAHLLQMAGEPVAAAEHYRRAARMTTSPPEQRYLRARAEALEGGGRGVVPRDLTSHDPLGDLPGNVET